MVGDNPRADIRGANNAGKPWQSVLLETGIFKKTPEQPNDPTDPADHVFPSVKQAVDLILETARK